MAIFARRRLQTMLDDLVPFMDEEQALGLVRRIENKEIEQALPAEMELGLTWTIAQLGEIEIEPEWYSEERRLPDLFTEKLFPGQDAIVEITSLSDAVLPADKGMRNASRKLSQEAGKLRRGAGRQVSYYFYEETVREGHKSIRRVCVPRELVVNETMRDQLRRWLVGQERHDGDKLHLSEGMLKVTLTWHDRQQTRYNFQTSMPPEIRHLTDNYLYRALELKAKQLRNQHFHGIRCVILADVGSTALRQFDRYDNMGRVYNGRQIVDSFLATSANPGIDAVAIVTARRSRESLASLNRTIDWKIGLLSRPGVTIDPSGFERVRTILPKPRLEGYQSRQLHEQSVFAPTARGRYMPTRLSWRKGERTEIRMSARIFLDVLAGRIPAERARTLINGNGPNVLALHLDRGETISGLRLEPRGPDADDDELSSSFATIPAPACSQCHIGRPSEASFQTNHPVKFTPLRHSDQNAAKETRPPAAVIIRGCDWNQRSRLRMAIKRARSGNDAPRRECPLSLAGRSIPD